MELLLGTNVLKGTNLLLSHSRHNRHNQIFALSKPILDLLDTDSNQQKKEQIMKKKKFNRSSRSCHFPQLCLIGQIMSSSKVHAS